MSHFGHGLLAVGRWLITTLTALVKALVSGQRREKFNIIINQWLAGLAAIIKKFLALPPRHRVLVITITVLVALFIQSLIATGVERQNSQSTSAYDQQITMIKENINATDSALIYNDEDRARQLIVAAQTTLNGLPRDSRRQRKTADDFASQLATYSAKLQHLTVIDSPTVLTNLESIIGGADGLTLLGGQLYAYQSTGKRLARINPADGTAADLGITTDAGAITVATVRDDKRLLLYHDNHRLTQFDASTNTVTPLDITLTGQENKIRDLGVYGSRLYILTPANNQIYRYTASLTGFGQPTNWLKSGDVGAAVAMAIDGSIYTVNTNGTIKRFVAGREQTVAISGLDPALTSPTQIWTDGAAKNLYILEPATKRVIIVDKEKKKMIAQYTATVFDALKDLAVDEAGKKLYVLSGNTVYTIGL